MKPTPTLNIISKWASWLLPTWSLFGRYHFAWRFPKGLSVKESTCQCRSRWRCGFDPWVGKIPWRRKQQPTPVFLPGESHGHRSLVGYSSYSHKESDMTQWLSMQGRTNRPKEHKETVKRITEMDRLETPGGNRFHLKLFALLEYETLHILHPYPPTHCFSKISHIHNSYM